MTSKEYEQRLEALEREIAALRQETVEEGSGKPPHSKPELNRGAMCYHLDSTGTVLSGLWNNTIWDCKRLAIGNVFLTDDAAEFAAERLKVISEMREWAGKWDDSFALAYNKLLSPDAKIQVVDRSQYSPLGEIRFATEEDAENCIKAVGKDRLIKYYFGVRDHEADAKTE